MDCNQCAHCIMTVLANKQRKFYFSMDVHWLFQVYYSRFRSPLNFQCLFLQDVNRFCGVVGDGYLRFGLLGTSTRSFGARVNPIASMPFHLYAMYSSWDWFFECDSCRSFGSQHGGWAPYQHTFFKKWWESISNEAQKENVKLKISGHWWRNSYFVNESAILLDYALLLPAIQSLSGLVWQDKMYKSSHLQRKWTCKFLEYLV